MLVGKDVGIEGLYKMQTIRAARLQGVGDKFFEFKKIYRRRKYEFIEDIFTIWGGEFLMFTR